MNGVRVPHPKGGDRLNLKFGLNEGFFVFLTSNMHTGKHELKDTDQLRPSVQINAHGLGRSSGVPFQSAKGIGPTIKMEPDLGNDSRINVVLLEVTRNPSTLDNAPARERR